MTTAETPAEPTITAEAAAAVPQPLRWLVRVQKPWSAPLAGLVAGAMAVFTVVCFVQLADNGRAPTWAAIGAVAGLVLTIGTGGWAFVLLQDTGVRFRTLYAELGADRPRPPAPPVPTDEVRLVWDGPERAVVHRGRRRVGELHPDLPMATPLLTRPRLGHGAPVDGEAGRLAGAVLARDGSLWRLALGSAEGPEGVVHRCRPGGRNESGEHLEIDGRGALEVKRWLADADLRWWELPSPTVEGLRSGTEVVWPDAPRHLSDDAVLWVLWRRIARELQGAARRERGERERTGTRMANNLP